MSKLSENTVCLDVTFRRPGIRWSFQPGEVEVRKSGMEADASGKADQSMVGVNRKILESPVYREITKLEYETHKWIEARSLPSPLKRGTYMIPLNLLEDVDAKMDDVAEKYAGLVSVFIAEYHDRIQEAAARLNELFDPEKYRLIEDMEAAFGIERRFMDFGIPDPEKLTGYLLEKEQKRWAAEMATAEEECRNALRVSMLGLCERLAHQLGVKPDGRKQQLTASAHKAMVEFLDLFESRDVLGDTELKAIVDKARQVIGGRTIDSLRQMEDVRDQAQGIMSEAAEALQAMVVEMPGRAIQLED